MFPLKSYVFLLLIVSIALMLVGAQELNNKNGYNHVNEYLLKTVKTDDLETNLKAVERKFHELEPERKFQLEKEEFYSALEDINVLADIVRNPMCNGFDYPAMENSALIVRGRKRIIKPEELSRVDLIIHLAFLERAKKCKNEYPKKFAELYKTLKPKLIKAVEKMTGGTFAKKPEMTNREYMEWLIDQEPLKQEHIDAVNNYVSEKSANHPDKANKLVMFRKFAIEPCIDYYWQVGYHFFDSIVADAKMFNGHEGYILDDDNLVEFYKALAYSKFCKEVRKTRFH